MDLEKKWHRRILFFVVYLIETIITVVTLSYFPMLFSDMGLNPTTYGVVGSLSLAPMVFKFFIGPLSDRFPIPFLRGKRRGYFILGAVLNCICLPLLVLNPVQFLILFAMVWFLQTLGVAIIDIMTDTFVIETRDIQNVKGRTGASLWIFGGVFVGGAIATGLVPLLEADLLSGLLVIAAIAAVPLILVFLLKAESGESVTRINILEAVGRNAKLKFVKMGLLFALLLNIDGGLLELNLEPFLMVNFGVGKQEIVGTLFLLTLLGVILGFIGYFFIDRIQKARLLMIINAIYVVPAVLLFYFITTGTLTYGLFVTLYAVFSLITGLSYVTYTGLFFDLSDPKAAGTMIALYITMVNLGMVLGIAVGGFLPMATIYLVVAIVCACRILPLAFIKAQDIEKEFYQKE
ncbi:MAG: MFS transporter [Candidatus Helarchaeota archaeon]|nr:MFS transporter [Candidatus Helarchaeota archaeon]